MVPVGDLANVFSRDVVGSIYRLIWQPKGTKFLLFLVGLGHVLGLLAYLVDLAILRRACNFVVVVLFYDVLYLPMGDFILFARSVYVLGFEYRHVLDFYLYVYLLDYFFFFYFPIYEFRRLHGLGLLLASGVLRFFPMGSCSGPGYDNHRRRCTTYSARSFFSTTGFVTTFRSNYPANFVDFVVVGGRVFILTYYQEFFICLFYV